jgi:hypothetical protein
MEIMTTKLLLEKLKEISPLGFQISRRNGLLNRTKCIYYTKNKIFLFDISEDFNFDEGNAMDEIEINKYIEEIWYVEEIIN